MKSQGNRIPMLCLTIVTAVTAAGAEVGEKPRGEQAPRAILAITRSLEHRALLSGQNQPFKYTDTLPNNLEPYSVVWLAEKTAIRETTGSRLERFVESGGSLVTSDVLPLYLGDVRNFNGTVEEPDNSVFSQRPTVTYSLRESWLGIQELSIKAGGGEARDSVKVPLPNELLGFQMEVRAIEFGRSFATIGKHTANGQTLISHQKSAVVYAYTSDTGGRFFYTSTATGLNKQQGLREIILAGLRWAGKV